MPTAGRPMGVRAITVESGSFGLPPPRARLRDGGNMARSVVGQDRRRFVAATDRARASTSRQGADVW